MCSYVMVTNKVNKLQADTGDPSELAAQLAFSRTLEQFLNSVCIRRRREKAAFPQHCSSEGLALAEKLQR